MKATTQPLDIYWDPFDTDIDTDPYDLWRRMRDEAPVYYNDRFDFYAYSQFADVEAAHRDPSVYLSSHGTVLEIMSQSHVNSGSMIFRDPPEHTRLRSMVSRSFTPRRMASLEDHIRTLCGALLAPWRDGATFDFVEDFGAPLPSMVICELLGFPAADREWAKQRIDTSFHIEPGVGMINDISLTAMIELHGYLTELLTARAADPGDDLLSGLTQCELNIDECADFAVLLISAGTETVARLLGWAAIVLDNHPDERAKLVNDPSLTSNAIEELLRYEAPSPVQGRWTSRPVEIHGQVIPADSKVLLLTGSAGRDNRKYAAPDRFDVERNFDHHVSFGFGIHFCLGAALARLEGKVAIEQALVANPSWVVDRDRAVRLHTSTVRGWSKVPVGTIR